MLRRHSFTKHAVSQSSNGVFVFFAQRTYDFNISITFQWNDAHVQKGVQTRIPTLA